MLNKEVLASILIGLGVYGLLTSSYSYFSMILFALGLYTICLFDLNLFTGKCGYVKDRLSILVIFKILVINLVSGYLVGLVFSLTSPTIVEAATEVVNKWDFSVSYFIRSMFCGVIMFIAVHTYKNKSNLGILLGVPLFILCGFQHCIANVVIMGVANTFSYSILLAIVGNWLGAVIIRLLMLDNNK